jgi:hypothetical protein
MNTDKARRFLIRVHLCSSVANKVIAAKVNVSSFRDVGSSASRPSRQECLRHAALILLLALCPRPARAVELHLQFAALEHMIAEAVFTQDGRRYVHNDKSNKCNFAYLEKPQIQGADGRLRIKAKFTGRSALNVIGQCVGLGDAFMVVMIATPQYRNGNIVLQNVVASSDGKTGIYIRKVCSILGASLERDFKYPLAAEAKRILEDASGQPGYKRELRDFQVPALRVTDDALVIQADFALIVK